MARVIQPPLDQLQDLPTPLTAGERQVLDLFNSPLAAILGDIRSASSERVASRLRPA